ncbi:MAG: BatA domain-containing protein [Bacteroidia bacterium]
MTFLNPSILWALLAIIVPIIVHFFNLQRPKQILFSNVRLVKEIKRNVVRRLRLRQWLLLASRILAIIGIVFAFAAPVFVNKYNKMLAGNRSVVIVVDNSYSMTAGNEKGAYLQQASTLAKGIVNTYTEKDEFLLMTTGGMLLNHNFNEKEQVLEELAKLTVRQKVKTKEEVVNVTNEIFARANNKVREMYFLSDFQNSTVMADSQRTKLKEIDLNDSTLLVKFVPLATREQKNVYLTGHKISSQIIEQGKPVQMKVTIVNDGEAAVSELGVRVNVEGKAVAIASHSVPAKSKQEITMTFTPTGSGWQSGYIELDDYPIEFDNKRFFSFYVPAQEKVLIVEGERSPNLHILYQDLFVQFRPTFVSGKEISTVQFSDYRAIVLAGLTEVSSGLSEKMNTFLKEGGSLMVFAGSNANLSSLNSFYQAAGIGQFSEMATVQGGTKASSIDLAHPIFQGVFLENQKNREFDAPQVYRYYPFSLSSSSTVQYRVMSLENQSPVLIESRIGNGILFTWTLFPGDAWTDLHVKTVFAPLMYRATQMMCRAKSDNSNQDLGNYTPVVVRSGKPDLIKLKGEKEGEYIPEQYQQGEATVLKFDKLNIKEGNYRIMQGETELGRSSFNTSDAESKLEFTSLDDLTDALADAGLSKIQVLRPDAHSVTQAIFVEKEGTPLWKYFIAAGLLFLLLEIFILRVGDGTWFGQKKEEVAS